MENKGSVQIIRRKPETRRISRIIYIMRRNSDDNREKKEEITKNKEEEGIKK
jgi:hypothetical protein